MTTPTHQATRQHRLTRMARVLAVPAVSLSILFSGGCLAEQLQTHPASYPSADQSALVTRMDVGKGKAAAKEAGRRPAKSTPHYDPQTDPFAANDQIRTIVSRLPSSPGASLRSRVDALFAALRVGGSEGVRVVEAADASGRLVRLPRTAAETLQFGGDCSDFATLAASALGLAGIPFEVQIVHITSSRADRFHMIVVVDPSHSSLLFDLQADSVVPPTGSISSGDGSGTQSRIAYSIIRHLSAQEAAYFYHVEAGDYLFDAGRYLEAAQAYQRAAQLYAHDAVVWHNLGVALEGVFDGADVSVSDRLIQAFEAAAREDPAGHAPDATRAAYHRHCASAEAAYGQRDFAGCAREFEAAIAALDALVSGRAVSSEWITDERAYVTANLGTCRSHAAGQ